MLPKLFGKMLGCVTGVLGSLVCQGCSVQDAQPERPMSTQEQQDAKRGRFFGKELTLFGGDQEDEKISVNPYMWQSALEVLKFMTVETSDIDSGFIQTAWHTFAHVPEERFQVLVIVSGGRVRTSGIAVHVFSQKNLKGAWQAQGRVASLERRLHEKILGHARILKSKSHD